jgi:hypothetical protein
MFTETKLIASAAGAFILVVAIGWGVTTVHHRGFVAGQNERTAYYVPLMRAANDARVAADARAAKADKAASDINVKSEEDHAKFVETLADRESTAASRITSLLRQHTVDSAARSSQLSVVAGASDPFTGAAASVRFDNGNNERITTVSAHLATIGSRCEHDAGELADWQRWYAEQRANAVAATVTP